MLRCTMASNANYCTAQRGRKSQAAPGSERAERSGYDPMCLGRDARGVPESVLRCSNIAPAIGRGLPILAGLPDADIVVDSPELTLLKAAAFEALRPSGQSLPMRSSTTRMIRMMPMTPMPP